MAKIILINGKKRSGKDYCANLIKDQLLEKNKTSSIMSFAEPLKSIISSTFNITIDELELYKNDTTKYEIILKEDTCPFMNTNFREILQRFGTEAMKSQFGDSVWVDLFKHKCKNVNTDFVIVPDFRFPCEAIGDYTVQIINLKNKADANSSHSSETALDNFKFDFTIDNTDYKNISKSVQNLIKHIV